MSRSRAAMLNWFASILFTVVTMLVGFMATPLIYRPLGKERYGVVLTLMQISAYLTLIAQGLGVALMPLLAKSIGKRDVAGTRRVLAAGLRGYGMSVGAILIIGLAVLPKIGWMIPVSPALLPELRLAWMLNLAGLPMIMFVPIKILVDIDQKGYLATLALISQSLTTTGLSIVLVQRGWGIAGVTAAALAGSIVFCTVLIVISRRSYRVFFVGIHRVKSTKEDWKSIGSLSGPTLLTMVCQSVGMLSDSIVLTNVRGAAAASTLSLNQRLATMGESALKSITAAVWPGLIDLHSRAEHEQFNQRLVELVRIVVVIGVAGLVPVVWLNDAFVARWIKDASLERSTWIAAAAAVNSLLLTFSSLFALPLVATGHVRLLAKPSMIAAAINLGISIVLAKLIGPVGPLIGTMVALLGINLWYYPVLLQSLFGISPRSLLGAAIKPLLWGIPYAGLVWGMVGLTRPTGLVTIFAFIGVAALLFLGFSYFAILSADERELWRGRFFTPLLRRFRREALTH